MIDGDKIVSGKKFDSENCYVRAFSVNKSMYDSPRKYPRKVRVVVGFLCARHAIECKTDEDIMNGLLVSSRGADLLRLGYVFYQHLM